MSDLGYLLRYYIADPNGLYSPFTSHPSYHQEGKTYTDFPDAYELEKPYRYDEEKHLLLTEDGLSKNLPHAGFSSLGLEDPAYSFEPLTVDYYLDKRNPADIKHLNLPEWFKNKYDRMRSGLNELEVNNRQNGKMPVLYSKLNDAENPYDKLMHTIQVYHRIFDPYNQRLALVETPVEHVLKAVDDTKYTPQRDNTSEIVTQSVKPVKVYNSKEIHDAVTEYENDKSKAEDIVKRLSENSNVLSDENYKIVLDDLSNWWRSNSSRNNIVNGLKAFDI